jgi:hypothetical protein
LSSAASCGVMKLAFVQRLLNFISVSINFWRIEKNCRQNFSISISGLECHVDFGDLARTGIDDPAVSWSDVLLTSNQKSCHLSGNQLVAHGLSCLWVFAIDHSIE